MSNVNSNLSQSPFIRVAGIQAVLIGLAIVVIVFVGGGEMSSEPRDSSTVELEEAVSMQCSQFATVVDSNYCSWYVNTEGEEPDCSDVRRDPAPGYDMTADDAQCIWQEYGGETLGEVLTDHEEFGDNRPIVRVQGADYDCIEEGMLSQQCPVQ